MLRLVIILTKYDAFTSSVNRVQVIDFEIWFKIHRNILKIPGFLVCAGCTGLSSIVIKVFIWLQDIVTRYAHQSGYHVERRFGWDCHGLPVVWFNIEHECIYCLARTLKKIIRNKIPEHIQCFSNHKFWCCHSAFLIWIWQKSFCHMSLGEASHMPRHSPVGP